MSLTKYEGKNIEILDDRNEIYIGHVVQYIYAEDNTPEEVESLILNRVVRKKDNYKYPYLVEFTANEIKSIKEI